MVDRTGTYILRFADLIHDKSMLFINSKSCFYIHSQVSTFTGLFFKYFTRHDGWLLFKNEVAKQVATYYCHCSFQILVLFMNLQQGIIIIPWQLGKKRSWWLPELCENDVFILPVCCIFQGFLVTFGNCQRTCSYRINLWEHVVLLCCLSLPVSQPPCLWDVEVSLTLLTYRNKSVSLSVPHFLFSCLKWMVAGWLVTLSMTNQYLILICWYLLPRTQAIILI